MVRALDLARELGAREVHLLLDSKLIVEQLAGRWRVKDAKLIPLWTAARRDAGRVRSLVGGARAARPELGRRRAGQRGDRPGAGGRPGVGGAAAALLRPAMAEPWRDDRRQATVRTPIARTALAIALVAWLVGACGGSSRLGEPGRRDPSLLSRHARRHELGRRSRSPAGRSVPASTAVHRVHGGSGEGHGRLQLVQWRLHVRPDDGVAHVRRADDDAHGLHRSGG